MSDAKKILGLQDSESFDKKTVKRAFKQALSEVDRSDVQAVQELRDAYNLLMKVCDAQAVKELGEAGIDLSHITFWEKVQSSLNSAATEQGGNSGQESTLNGGDEEQSRNVSLSSLDLSRHDFTVNDLQGSSLDVDELLEQQKPATDILEAVQQQIELDKTAVALELAREVASSSGVEFDGAEEVAGLKKKYMPRKERAQRIENKEQMRLLVMQFESLYATVKTRLDNDAWEKVIEAAHKGKFYDDERIEIRQFLKEFLSNKPYVPLFALQKIHSNLFVSTCDDGQCSGCDNCDEFREWEDFVFNLFSRCHNPCSHAYMFDYLIDCNWQSLPKDDVLFWDAVLNCDDGMTQALAMELRYRMIREEPVNEKMVSYYLDTTSEMDKAEVIVTSLAVTLLANGQNELLDKLIQKSRLCFGPGEVIEAIGGYRSSDPESWQTMDLKHHENLPVYLLHTLANKALNNESISGYSELFADVRREYSQKWQKKHEEHFSRVCTLCENHISQLMANRQEAVVEAPVVASAATAESESGYDREQVLVALMSADENVLISQLHDHGQDENLLADICRFIGMGTFDSNKKMALYMTLAEVLTDKTMSHLTPEVASDVAIAGAMEHPARASALLTHLKGVAPERVQPTQTRMAFNSSRFADVIESAGEQDAGERLLKALACCLMGDMAKAGTLTEGLASVNETELGFVNMDIVAAYLEAFGGVLGVELVRS